MPAQHKKATYKPPDLENPFRAGQDNAYADLLWENKKDLRWWRSVVGPGSLLLFLSSLCLNVCEIKQQKIVPVLVNVMPSGEAQYLGEVRQNGAMQVPEAAVHYQVRNFIVNLRSVSTDYQVVYNNIDECFSMVTNGYSPILRQHLLADSPFSHVGKLRRTVEVESVLSVTARSYQINWTETAVDSSSTRKIAKMRAVVSVRLIQPTDETIKKNPLGIYIENCEMAEL